MEIDSVEAKLPKIKDGPRWYHYHGTNELVYLNILSPKHENFKL
ncbi:MAG TPA: hypothetical protein VJ772_07145 [Nitrososphaeraceae archaeon]|nr:hypothetical protein [Nitrososphaeraceae archaeon]